jgi:hypothetical protein
MNKLTKGGPVMRTKILRYGAAALLLLGVSVFLTGPAQALAPSPFS